MPRSSRPSSGRRSLLLAAAAAALPVMPVRALPLDPVPPWPRRQRPLRLGVIDLSFHRASAGVVAEVLRAGGVPVELVVDVHERIYDRLRRGEIDMAVSAWLPGSHGDYIRGLDNDLLRLGVLYQPYALWGVPDYVPVEILDTIGDLRRDDVRAAITVKRIQGIGPGAGISRFSREIMQRYDLGAHGYEFMNGSLRDCVQAFESAVAERRWVVVPLWRPQYLHARHRIRDLRDPVGLLRGVDDATLLLRRDARALIPDATLKVLAGMSLGNETVAALDEQVGRDGQPAERVAAEWLARHPTRPTEWALAGDRVLAAAPAAVP
ncbi:glycine betaine ABC transporter substrate-binding protein [Mitsuaria sp. GD03876]|uniref:glycine betaine ABC transporter substrate-binding protein n=1 Tax=Mitsuaria sp. GD03876 TaxID=2975399 RepID=UPI00244CF94F|nr:glycine betaine ABC transporter substrate-binding protein [Mitsuaria sp. GD03876]MDH0864346.1 glycine betaine ABC transporter substrate-binding protein [Mitsuaria sp. GD03876]